MLLLVFEFLGTTELLVIAFVALIIFGPRKLPELGRSLGKSLGEFKRASEDFKRTWEREVDTERIERELRIETEAREARDKLLDGEQQYTIAAAPIASEPHTEPDAMTDFGVPHYADGEAPYMDASTVARTPTATTTDLTEASGVDASTAPATRKQDWF